MSYAKRRAEGAPIGRFSLDEKLFRLRIILEDENGKQIGVSHGHLTHYTLANKAFEKVTRLAKGEEIKYVFEEELRDLMRTFSLTWEEDS